MKDLTIKLGREEDGDIIGKLFCYIADSNINGTKYYLGSLDQVGDTVRDFIKENYEDDGADICYRVR